MFRKERLDHLRRTKEKEQKDLNKKLAVLKEKDLKIVKEIESLKKDNINLEVCLEKLEAAEFFQSLIKQEDELDRVNKEVNEKIEKLNEEAKDEEISVKRLKEIAAQIEELKKNIKTRTQLFGECTHPIVWGNHYESSYSSYEDSTLANYNCALCKKSYMDEMPKDSYFIHEYTYKKLEFGDFRNKIKVLAEEIIKPSWITYLNNRENLE